MLVQDIIRKMLEKTNHSQLWLAHRMGYTSNSGVANMLARGNMMLENLWEICAILDYEIVIQPKEVSRRGKLKDGAMLVTWEGK